MPAMPADASMARGTFLAGSLVSPTWQAAASKAGAVNPIRYRPAITSVMAGLYLIGFTAPAFEAAACHVGETKDPAKNVPRAMLASAGMAGIYFIALPLVWLGVLGPEKL